MIMFNIPLDSNVKQNFLNYLNSKIATLVGNYILNELSGDTVYDSVAATSSTGACKKFFIHSH